MAWIFFSRTLAALTDVSSAAGGLLELGLGGRHLAPHHLGVLGELVNLIRAHLDVSGGVLEVPLQAGHPRLGLLLLHGERGDGLELGEGLFGSLAVGAKGGNLLGVKAGSLRLQRAAGTRRSSHRSS